MNECLGARAMLVLLLALAPAMAATPARALSSDTLTVAFVVDDAERATSIGSKQAEVADSVLATFAAVFPYWDFVAAADGAMPSCRLRLLGADGSKLELDLFDRFGKPIGMARTCRLREPGDPSIPSRSKLAHLIAERLRKDMFADSDPVLSQMASRLPLARLDEVGPPAEDRWGLPLPFDRFKGIAVSFFRLACADETGAQVSVRMNGTGGLMTFDGAPQFIGLAVDSPKFWTWEFAGHREAFQLHAAEFAALHPCSVLLDSLRRTVDTGGSIDVAPGDGGPQ